jgi:hypothetical protein
MLQIFFVVFGLLLQLKRGASPEAALTSAVTSSEEDGWLLEATLSLASSSRQLELRTFSQSKLRSAQPLLPY